MKTLSILVLFLVTANSLSAQTPNLEKAITDGLVLLDRAKSQTDFQELVNRFERIAQAAPDRWEPLYYLAFCRLNSSYQESDGTIADRMIDQAEENIKNGLLLNGDKSELHTLSAFSCQCRINVNASRGMTYSLMAKDFLETAIRENPENPRAYYLLGMNIYYTPEGFGGGCSNALPLFLKASEKFKVEAGRSDLLPKWGAASNNQLLEQCNH